VRYIRYPLVKQQEVSDCGAACLSMIIKFYNGYVDIETLREMTNTDKSGVSAYHLIEASKKLNFEAYGIKCSLDNLKDLKVILPCIAHVIINKTYQHYIVIYKINYHKHNLIIADPNGHIGTTPSRGRCRPSDSATRLGCGARMRLSNS
jgi:ATP-binding cassette subfamily B protein